MPCCRSTTSRDPEQAYFSEGITEDLITDLSQISGLFVTSRHSVFQYRDRAVTPQQVGRDLGVRYVLEGSVRRAANRVRINAQLIDAVTGFYLWAQRYDRDFEDIFALQDEITHTIVAALEIQLTPKERDVIARRYTDNLEAYDLFLQAREAHLLRRTRKAAERVRVALERAIELDPEFAAAYALLAENNRQEWMYEWRDDANTLDHALKLAREAVRLDPKLPLAHILLGSTHLWRKEHDAAIAEAQRSVELDPNNAEAWVRLGHILDHAGRPREGLPMIEKAMRLDPHHPFIYPFYLGCAFYSLERYEEALGAYERASSRNPEFIAAHQYLAATYAVLGRDEEARRQAAKVLRLDPRFSIRRLAHRLPLKNQAILSHYVDALRRAGLPE